MEGLSNIHNFSYNENASKSMKNKPGIIMMKNNQGIRNSVLSNKNVGVTEKHKESLADKFMRKSEEFNRKRPDFASKSLSRSKQNKLDFAGLSMNSRRKHKNRELKESVRIFKLSNNL